MSHIRASLLLWGSSSSTSIGRIFLSWLLRRILFLIVTRSYSCCRGRWNYYDILAILSWSQICCLQMNLFVIFCWFCLWLLRLWIALIILSFWWSLVLCLRLWQLIARCPTHWLILSRWTHWALGLTCLGGTISASHSLLLPLLASFLGVGSADLSGTRTAGTSTGGTSTSTSWASGCAKGWCSHPLVVSCRRSGIRLLLRRISFMTFGFNLATFDIRWLWLLRTQLSSIWCSRWPSSVISAWCTTGSILWWIRALVSCLLILLLSLSLSLSCTLTLLCLKHWFYILVLQVVSRTCWCWLLLISWLVFIGTSDYMTLVGYRHLG